MRTVLVGCGRMGGALLRGWAAAGVSPIHVIDPNVASAPGATVLDGFDALANLPGPIALVLAVKPGMVVQALAAARPHMTAGGLAISIAAGVTLASLRQAAGPGGEGAALAVVRAMPNTPAAIGKGAVGAVSDASLSDSSRQAAERLLGAAGEMFWLEEEALIDAVTAVSGSGPAYFYRFTELLAEAGRELGLPAEMAARLAELTFTGAGAWLEASGRDPASLRVEVTSPNGVTAAALAAFDADAALAQLIGKAARAAVARSREMGS